jgi:hypothetical protein
VCTEPLAKRERWEWDGEEENCPTDYAVSYAREFRYDNAMQRYMNIELDPADDRPQRCVPADFNRDRHVDLADFAVVQAAAARP